MRLMRIEEDIPLRFLDESWGAIVLYFSILYKLLECLQFDNTEERKNLGRTESLPDSR